MLYAIYEDFFNTIEKKLNRIAKKCQKNGNSFTFNVQGEEIREVYNKEKDCNEYYKFIMVEVEGTAKIDNWECIAVLEVHSSGNIIRRINTDIEVPDRFKHTENFCEHCNSIRHRKNLYIIHNIETDEWKQIGGNCLAQYTNGLNMEYVSAYMDGITELEENNGYINYGCCRPFFEVEEILSYAVEVIEKVGYFNADSTMPTKSIVREFVTNNDIYNAIYRINKDFRYFHIEAEFEKADFHKETTENQVEKIIEYYNNLDDTSEFVHNVKVLLKEGYADAKNIGFLCYLPVGYAKHIAKQKKEKEKMENSVKSVHFGEIGKRYKNEKVKSFEFVTAWTTDFGVTSIYKITLEDDSILTWKTNNSIDLENTVKYITFTVKEHKEYKGEKQTEVTRCKLEY